MDVENSFIKPILNFFYSKGMSEGEAYEEVSKRYGPRAISLKTVRKWYATFKPINNTSINTTVNSQKLKLTDENLIKLINENPELSMKQLEKISGCSSSAISRRLNFLDNGYGRVIELKKKFQLYSSKPLKNPKKFTDNYLINLVNENPELSMKGLAIIANCSKSTILTRLNQINSDEVKVNYIKKGFRMGAPKFTDDYLINLISNNPGLNIIGLAKLANTSSETISTRLKQINNNREQTNKILLKKNSVKSIEGANKLTDEFIIQLINQNPELNMKELAKLAGTSKSFISKWLNKINSEEERVNYNFKQGEVKLTDESLIELINENPQLNMKELANLAGTTAKTISIRLKQINSNEQRVNYSKKDHKKGVSKISDDYLIELINNNPGLNKKELGKLANVSGQTISRRIKKINDNMVDGSKLILI